MEWVLFITYLILYFPKKIQSQLFQNTIASNIPLVNDINIQQFMQPPKSSSSASNTESYFEQWSKMAKLGVANNSKLANNQTPPQAPLTEEEIQVNQMKAKYFAAWRKYTLRKRKQQQQQQQQVLPTTISSSTTSNGTKPSLTPQVSSNSETSTQKQAIISLGDQFSYDLKSKWLKNCLFCPR